MSLFNNLFDDSFNSMYNNNNNNSSSGYIECSNCSNNIKYLRCKGCNNYVSLNEFINYLNSLTAFDNNIKVRLTSDKNGVKLIQVPYLFISIIIPFLKNQNAGVYGLNFSYEVNYMKNTENDAKIVNNLEITQINKSFKNTNLLMSDLVHINDNNKEGAVILLRVSDLLIYEVQNKA